uniref:Uncharacterized protein n=1 Tax=Virgibacillus oceani TaxID=1479511 RepID=A0A917GZS0_9BACI|nr:hypothetical protein GCM10011398_03390 [Virgibacillus oceani]
MNRMDHFFSVLKKRLKVIDKCGGQCCMSYISLVKMVLVINTIYIYSGIIKEESVNYKGFSEKWVGCNEMVGNMHSYDK